MEPLFAQKLHFTWVFYRIFFALNSVINYKTPPDNSLSLYLKFQKAEFERKLKLLAIVKYHIIIL